MKKLFKWPILILFIMLSFSIGFFTLFKGGNNTQQIASADITGLSGEVVYLTGTQGYQPYHYFTNENGQSTLSYANGEVSAQYYNENGELCNNYYAIYGDSEFFANKKSTGYAKFVLTNEMKNLAQAGILYVQASAGIVSRESDQNDKIKISVTNGTNAVSVSSTTVQSGDGIANPEWIKTDFIRVSPEDVVKFSFETLAAGGGFNYSKFRIFEPKIIFKVIVEETTFETKSNVVYPGQILNLTATNEVLNQAGDSDYLKYYRNLFKISYKITQGAKYASISSGKLLVKSNAPNNTTITISASNRKDSINGGTTTPKIVTFTVNAKKYEVKIKSDFQDPATFTGNGNFYEGQKITLKATPKTGYVFKKWIINGKDYTSASVNYQVLRENDISIEFVKNTKVVSIRGVTKAYDGSAYTEYTAVLEGVDPNHDVKLGGITARYFNADFGENKKLILEGSPELIGKDKDLYELTTFTIPEGCGDIQKRDVTVTANKTTKTYGDRDEKISYISSQPDYTLSGELTRAQGESVGVYQINADGLINANKNFNITFVTAQFEIVPRVLNIEFESIEKVYDQTNNAFINYNIMNSAFDDTVSLELEAKFASRDVGRQKINFTKANIMGSQASNYLMPDLNSVYGNILQREIVVTADAKEKVFGDQESELTYVVNGKLEGDELYGSLSREQGMDVGVYKILLNTLGNPNYQIKFNSANYVITKRQVRVLANPTEKVYAEIDPTITYVAENIVDSAPLRGNLSRENGENVGVYQINIGNLNNPNYDIKFTTNEFKILKREATVEIEILSKDYDGNSEAQYNYIINNLAPSDSVTVDYILRFEDENAGQKRVIIESSSYSGTKVENYEFMIVGALSGRINKKSVNLTILNTQKIYGQQDPEIDYMLDGVVGNDEISLQIQREQGEDSGVYEIDFVISQNDNYNIVYNQVAQFEILPKTLNIKAVDCSKVFGEEDPKFEFVVSEPLEFNEQIDDVITGQLEREGGKNPARYKILLGTLRSSSNYTIEFTYGYLTISKRNVTVRAVDATKIYGEEDPVFVYTAENTVEGSDLLLSLRREYGENVGEYSISYTSLNDPRYNIEFVCATFSITPRAIRIKADNKYKTYGGDDPEFSVSVVEGELQFNDNPTEIFNGQMSREGGETIGTYTINQGTYTLGNNYQTEFETGELVIIKTEIEIKANKIIKKYGNQDGELTFTITKGSLKFNDQVEGSLERTQGEAIGIYDISQGTLSLNENYNLTFIPSQFVIEKRPIEICADAITKTYGEQDPELTYTIVGGVVEGDVFEGGLSREKPQYEQNPELCEYAGRYMILSTISNDNYDITYVPNYLTIKQREIYITADDKSKFYGEDDPELTYHITQGEILDDVELQGNIYRVSGNDAGKYDIRSNLTLGRNYKIVFTKGVFEIKQLTIRVRTNDYEKIYGEGNPTFEYEIIEGQLLNGDKLLGGVSKEDGEDVGIYRLVSAFNNTNYKVELTENYLTIHPKDAYLNVSIQDKVYNGDTVAYIRQPSVTGLIDDDITILYDKENCARFVSPVVGNHIAVTLYDISLAGEKAGNYTLHIPTEVYGNITNNQLSTEDQKVMLETTTNTDLTKGSTLKSDTQVNVEKFDSASKELVCAYNVWIEGGSTSTQLKDSITVKFELPTSFKGRNNFYVYGTNKDGQTVLLNSKVNGDYLEIETDCLGEFIVLSDNEQWINICVYISAGIVGLMAIWLVVYEVKKHSKAKKKKA